MAHHLAGAVVNSLKQAKRAARNLIPTPSMLRTYWLMRNSDVPQPNEPIARVVFSAMTKGGANANGKVSASLFIPPFSDELRRNGISVEWAYTKKDLRRRLSGDLPVFLIHLYGEDNENILCDDVLLLEEMAIAVFNSAKVGPLLADKLASHNAFRDAGVAVPPLSKGTAFVRSRYGSGNLTEINDGVTDVEQKNDGVIRNQFIDTRIRFANRSFFTTVRLLCVDNTVLHAYPRARDENEGNASVHAKDTPVVPELIEYLHQELILPFEREFKEISEKLHGVLGHGFFVHDLLIESGSVFLCESGIKFDAMALASRRRFEPIAENIPSQAPLFPVQELARRSARAFIAKCQPILKCG